MMCSARASSYSRCPTSRNRSLYLLVPMGVPLVDDVTRGEAARSSMLAWTRRTLQVGSQKPEPAYLTAAPADRDAGVGCPGDREGDAVGVVGQRVASQFAGSAAGRLL